MSDTSPLLTATQRETLEAIAAGETELTDNHRTRSRIRSRVRSVLMDTPFLLATLPRKDHEMIFDGIDEYREESIRKGQELWETEFEDVDPWPPDRIRPTDLSFQETEGEELYWGVVATLAFLYSGVDDDLEFEHMLEQAIKGARRMRGGLPLNVEVTIDISRETVDIDATGVIGEGEVGTKGDADDEE